MARLAMVSGIGLVAGMLSTIAWAADPEPSIASQQDKQRRVQGYTEHMVRRIRTMLRVLDYYQLDKRTEKQLLAEVMATLAGLNKEQMTEVMARLEAAAIAPDEKNLQKELEEAYTRHRQIVESLKNLLAKYEAVKDLDQAADRMEKYSKDQLELYVHTSQLAQLQQDLAQISTPRGRTSGAGLTMITEIPAQADNQRDLYRNLAGLFQQLKALRDQLPVEQKQRLNRIEKTARNLAVVEKLAKAADLLPTTVRNLSSNQETWKAATGLQRQAAADMQELAHMLRSQPDKVAALREARRRLERAIEIQETLKQEAQVKKDPPKHQDPKDPESESAQHARELGARQARLEHETRDTRALVKPHAEPVARKIEPAEAAMQEAEQALRKNSAGNAVQLQAKAAENLREAKKDLDRMIAEAEKLQGDPLAAMKKTAETVEQLIKEQKDLRDKTKEADQTRHPERLPSMTGKQEKLAQRTDDLKHHPMSSMPEAQTALDKAARTMENAGQALEEKKGPQAVTQQNQALQSLEEAKKQLGDQIAAMEKRRDEIAKLEDAAQKLEELTKQEGKVATNAKEMAKDLADPNSIALAKKQGELMPWAKDVGKQLAGLAPEAAKQVADSVKNMEAAKGELEKKQPAPAATQAEEASKKLMDAQKALAKALDEKKGMEIAAEASMQPGQVDPAKAAQQIAKALEQTQKAAQNSEQAAAQMGKKPQDEKANLAEMQKQAAQQAMTQSQQANQAAMAAIGQAQAQAPPMVQPQLQSAAQQLTDAAQQLRQEAPQSANQSQLQAAAQLGQALQSLNAALAGMGQPAAQPGQPAEATASAAQSGQARGQPQGQGPKPGQGQTQGQQGQSQERNQNRGTGDRIADGKVKNAPSQLMDVQGDGLFIYLPSRQRELIRQALSEKLPPEYAALIQQYYINLARGKPAAKPMMPEKK